MGLVLAKHTEIRELNRTICASNFPVGRSVIYHVPLYSTGHRVEKCQKTVNVNSYEIHKEI